MLTQGVILTSIQHFLNVMDIKKKRFYFSGKKEKKKKSAYQKDVESVQDHKHPMVS